MSRLPALTAETMSPAQQSVYDAILAGPRGRVEGPLRVWVQSPKLAETAQALGAFCRFGTSLPPRLSELAILTTGAFWRAGFEWAVHAPIGIAAGLDAASVEAMRTGGQPAFTHPDERLVHQFVHEALQTKRVSNVTYRAAETALGATALVELVGIVGYYTLICLTINAFEVNLPEGAVEPFA